MKTKVTRWGNSAAIRLSKDTLELLNVKEGDTVALIPQDNGVLLVRNDSEEARKEFKKLVRQIIDRYENVLIELEKYGD